MRVKRLAIVVLPFVLIAAGACGAMVGTAQPARPLPKPSVVYVTPLSYRVMQLAQDQVKVAKPAPTLAALDYAYIAKGYDDVYQTDSRPQALYASQVLMGMVLPERQAQIDNGFAQLAAEHHIAMPTAATPAAQKVVSSLRQRYSQDGHALAWNHIVPAGAGKWTQRTAADPMTPRAGEWQRWNVTAPITVPPPPVNGSQQDIDEINGTVQASASRTGEDVNTINFWGGVPGTETPSGIWQNQLFKTVELELKSHPQHADHIYASMQSHLATTLSDAFMECWKVKYTYWTARPDMRDSRIHTAMPNPNFPSYVSGHSTISKAAADVLSVQAPKYTTAWQDMAVQARQSRLKAGIHFNVDNMAGFQLGADVAKQSIANLQLRRVL